MLHFWLEIIIMTRSTKTRLLLRDKCKVVHSDRLYRPDYTQYVRINILNINKYNMHRATVMKTDVIGIYLSMYLIQIIDY